jgi:hypothetical protein
MNVGTGNFDAREVVRSWGLTLGAEVEGCFRIAGTHSAALESHKPAPEAPRMERVSFYKGARPFFVAEIHFCDWCYHALLFQPIANLREWKVFWVRETNQVGDYIEGNEDFYPYYLDDQNGRDQDLFGGEPEDANRCAEILVECVALDNYAD